MSLSFRTTIARYIPPWLAARVASGKVRGFKILYTLALLADLGMENAYQGLQAGFPGVGTPEALPLIGRDRCIRRGIDETDEAYAARLITWLDDWKGAGNPFAIMHAVRGFCAPAMPRIRIVNASGTWYTLNPDDSVEIVQTWGAINWNWDGLPAALPTQIWVIIYSDAGPWTVDGTWGDGGKWGDGRSWGTSATPDQVRVLRSIVNDFKSAGDRCRNIIIAFDPASFVPGAAPNASGMPDGSWGHWSKTVAGVRVAARLETARYFDGV